MATRKKPPFSPTEGAVDDIRTGKETETNYSVRIKTQIGWVQHYSGESLEEASDEFLAHLVDSEIMVLQKWTRLTARPLRDPEFIAEIITADGLSFTMSSDEFMKRFGINLSEEKTKEFRTACKSAREDFKYSASGALSASGERRYQYLKMEYEPANVIRIVYAEVYEVSPAGKRLAEIDAFLAKHETEEGIVIPKDKMSALALLSKGGW